MVVKVNLEYMPYSEYTDALKQEKFMVEEKKDIEGLSSSFEELVNRFKGFEIAPKIKDLDEEIAKLGYNTISRDAELSRYPFYVEWFPLTPKRRITTSSNFVKKNLYLFWRETKKEHPKDCSIKKEGEYLVLVPKNYNATYSIKGNIIFPPVDEYEAENDVLKKAISKCFC